MYRFNVVFLLEVGFGAFGTFFFFTAATTPLGPVETEALKEDKEALDIIVPTLATTLATLYEAGD